METNGKSFDVLLRVVMLAGTLASAWFSAQNQIAILQLEVKLERRIQEELKTTLREYVRRDSLRGLDERVDR